MGAQEAPDIEAAWATEIARRSLEIDEAKVKPMPWSKVKDAVRRLTPRSAGGHRTRSC
ncbi:MAG: addiction module protein [Planctomycetes bacterium]|nr:addiction module protein [Planctomycetota bacterium]